MDLKVQNSERTDKIEQLGKPKEEPKVVIWFNVVVFGLLHLMWLYSFILILKMETKLITIIYSLLIGFYVSGIGITLGAHRLWSHRSYKAKLPLRLFLLFGQTIASQNCLWTWVRDHRMHHKYSDTDADPHNSKRGLFFSHMGWLMMKKHPDVRRKGKQIDMSDLEADPWIMFQKKYYIPLNLLFSAMVSIVIPYYLLNDSLWNCLMVCYIFRLALSLHFTWSVNSFAHKYGNKPYEKEIIPVENPCVSIVALGEGWHNFHHAFPWDCNASEYGKHFNITSRFLSFFAYLGQAYDLKMVTKEMVTNRIKKHGDGTHPLYESIAEVVKKNC